MGVGDIESQFRGIVSEATSLYLGESEEKARLAAFKLCLRTEKLISPDNSLVITAINRADVSILKKVLSAEISAPYCRLPNLFIDDAALYRNYVARTLNSSIVEVMAQGYSIPLKRLFTYSNYFDKYAISETEKAVFPRTMAMMKGIITAAYQVVRPPRVEMHCGERVIELLEYLKANANLLKVAGCLLLIGGMTAFTAYHFVNDPSYDSSLTLEV